MSEMYVLTAWSHFGCWFIFNRTLYTICCALSLNMYNRLHLECVRLSAIRRMSSSDSQLPSWGSGVGKVRESLICSFVYLMFFTRDSIAGSAYMLLQFRPSVCLSVCPSVRPSHGWISQKRLKLRSCSFHHTVAPSL